MALAALGSAVGGGFGLFSKVGSAVVRGALNGIVGNVAFQGIATATGLQSKFDFAGVAAAGVGGGVGGFLGDKLGLKPLNGAGKDLSLGNIAGHTLTGSARTIASAATRSAINGSSFGDNVTRSLPSAIGQTLGAALGGALEGGGNSAIAETRARNEQATGNPVADQGGVDTAGERAAAVQQLASTPVGSSARTPVGSSAREIVVIADRHMRDLLQGMTDLQFWGLYLPNEQHIRSRADSIYNVTGTVAPVRSSLHQLAHAALNSGQGSGAGFGGLRGSIISASGRWTASVHGWQDDYADFAEGLRSGGFGGQLLSAGNMVAGIGFGVGGAITSTPGIVADPKGHFIHPIAYGIDGVFRDDRPISQVFVDAQAYLSGLSGTNIEMAMGGLLPLLATRGTGAAGRVASLDRTAGGRVPLGYTRAHRAVSQAEFDDIVATSRFNQGPNSLEGKWFADSYDDVLRHGDGLEGSGNYRVVVADLPDNASSLYRVPNLDNRGPARFLHMDDLQGVTPWPYKPR